MEIGQSARDVAFDLADGRRATISDYSGAPLVLYFYPKDDTSGCTTEAQDFSRLLPDFARAGVAVLGVSKDSVASHDKFTTKFGLSVPLASDSDGSASEAFGVWVEKSMYGKKYMGIERATFLIDKAGQVAAKWRKVKVPRHADAVLKAALALKQG